MSGRRLVESNRISNATRGFALTFAAEPFPGHDAKLRWLRSDGYDGNWYEGTVVGQRKEGRRCPALLRYF